LRHNEQRGVDWKQSSPDGDLCDEEREEEMKRIRFGLAVAVLLSSPLHAGFIQQGGKLVGAGVLVSNAYQGVSVGVSADGNTAVVGGYGDSSNVGAAWVFTRSSGVWTQQGGKLIGASAVGAAS
jgi:hypothetical protein